MKSLCLVLALTLCTIEVAAQIPRTFSYQGVLCDSQGDTVASGPYTMIFSLYDALSAGTLWWRDTLIDVPVKKGVFSVILGLQKPLAFPFLSQFWLGVKVGTGAELSPRIQLASAPYALSGVKTVVAVSGLAGGGSSDTVTLSVQDGGITALKLANGSVTQFKIGSGVSLPPNGDAGGDLTGTYPNPIVASDAITTTKILDGNVTASKLANTAVSPGSYGSATQVGTFTVDAQGRLTTASNVTVSGIAPGGVAGGDLSGTYPNPNIVKLQNRTLASTAPSNGQAIVWNNASSRWEPGSPLASGAAGGDLSGTFPNPSVATNAITTTKILDANVTASKLANTSVTPGTYGSATQVGTFTVDGQGRLTAASNVTVSGVTPGGAAGGDLSGTYPNPSVIKLQARSLSSTAPSNGQAIIWNSAANQWEPATVNGSLTLPYAGSVNYSGDAFAVTNTSSNTNSSAIHGTSAEGLGVRGTSTNNAGIFGVSSIGSGVTGYATVTTGSNATGVYGSCSQPNGFGVYGSKSPGGTGYAIYAAGTFAASGTKSFEIDHPLRPQTGLLRHFCSEGPEPYNIYSGNTTLNSSGEAEVFLPDYFGEINRDPRYTLTAVGAAMPDLHVTEEIYGNRFKIGGGVPGKKVSWRIEAVRNDQWIRAYGFETEVAKDVNDTYVNPELFGQPREKSIHPQLKQDPQK